MGKCTSCDLQRIYKQFAEKRRKAAQAKLLAETKKAEEAFVEPAIEELIVPVVEAPKKKTRSKKAAPAVEEEVAEIVKEDVPEVEAAEDIADHE